MVNKRVKKETDHRQTVKQKTNRDMLDRITLSYVLLEFFILMLFSMLERTVLLFFCQDRTGENDVCPAGSVIIMAHVRVMRPLLTHLKPLTRSMAHRFGRLQRDWVEYSWVEIQSRFIYYTFIANDWWRSQAAFSNVKECCLSAIHVFYVRKGSRVRKENF